MNELWSDIANAIEPYIPGEQPKDRKYIKLNTNENPYLPSDKVFDAIKQAANESLKLYPDPNCYELRRKVADYYGLESEQIFPGNGSDEILAFSFLAFFNPKSTIFFPDITYSFFPVYSDLFKIEYECIPLDSEFKIKTESYINKNGGIVISNPNAPTGLALSVDEIEEIVKNNKKNVVIIDEAYIDFGAESSYKLIEKYENLLVVQTLSKGRSLAGLRLGFAMGNKKLIEALDKIKNSFNSYTVDRLAVAGAIAALEDNEYFLKQTNRIIDTRNKITNELKELGFKVLDSKTKFLFVSNSKMKAEDICCELRKRGILVRYFNKDRIDNFLRISIGNNEEMEIFMRELREIMV